MLARGRSFLRPYRRRLPKLRDGVRDPPPDPNPDPPPNLLPADGAAGSPALPPGDPNLRPAGAAAAGSPELFPNCRPALLSEPYPPVRGALPPDTAPPLPDDGRDAYPDPLYPPDCTYRLLEYVLCVNVPWLPYFGAACGLSCPYHVRPALR